MTMGWFGCFAVWFVGQWLLRIRFARAVNRERWPEVMFDLKLPPYEALSPDARTWRKIWVIWSLGGLPFALTAAVLGFRALS